MHVYYCKNHRSGAKLQMLRQIIKKFLTCGKVNGPGNLMNSLEWYINNLALRNL